MVSKIVAPDGFIYTNGKAFGTTVYLSKISDVSKWKLITEEEYKKAMETQQYIVEQL